jgi:hypothetical protein
MILPYFTTTITKTTINRSDNYISSLYDGVEVPISFSNEYSVKPYSYVAHPVSMMTGTEACGGIAAWCHVMRTALGRLDEGFLGKCPSRPMSR